MNVLSHFTLSDNFFMTLLANMSNISSSLDGTKSTKRGKQRAAIVGTSTNPESPSYVGVLNKRVTIED
jgi:hypothetical protein